MNNNCHSQKEKTLQVNAPATLVKSFSSILSSCFILLLPKCPFCIVAYSSAVTLCSASGVIEQTTHHTDWGAYVAVALGAIIALCILFTFKMKRGLFAYIITSTLAIGGVLFIYTGIFHLHTMSFYYYGAALLMLSTFIYSNIYSRLFKALRWKTA